jgi:tRNA (guanine37-N1)-methyltransferase
MKIDILTIFPEAIEPYTKSSMLKKAQDEDLAEIKVHDLRKWTNDTHKTVDDRPFGGGPGMVLKLEPIYKALKELLNCSPKKRTELSSVQSVKVVLTSVRGKIFNQKKAEEFSKLDHLILIAGHYEGVDERIKKYLTDEAISIGNYVLTGGELPALVIVDAVVRLIPGVLGEPESLKKDLSQKAGALAVSYPIYTRPEVFETETGEHWPVPKVLLSGNHQKIQEWREQRLKKIT